MSTQVVLTFQSRMLCINGRLFAIASLESETFRNLCCSGTRFESDVFNGLLWVGPRLESEVFGGLCLFNPLFE